MFADVSDGQVRAIETPILSLVALAGILIIVYGAVGLARRRSSLPGNKSLTALATWAAFIFCLLLGFVVVGFSCLVWLRWIKINLIF